MTRAVLFDLDGTLVDTRAASWELFAQTNLAFALGIDTREEFFRVFEGNFFESLSRLVPDPQRAAAVKAHFMELLRTRYHPALIPGMVDVVRALAPHCALAVLSTNSMEAIRRILGDAGIATCFSHVFAGDVEPSKAESIRRFLADQRYRALRQCSPAYHDEAGGPEPLQAQDVVLVTDTVGDIVEAREAGIRSIGVAWGMHSEHQLIEAGAERVALWPQELVAWLRPVDTQASATCAPHCSCTPGHPPARRDEPFHASPAPATNPVSDAGRVRRERQLQSRLSAAMPPAAVLAAPTTTTSPCADAELRSALARIVRTDEVPAGKSRN